MHADCYLYTKIMEWINAKYRQPEKFGKYFVKINGVPNIISQQEFEGILEKMEEGDTLEWLEEIDQTLNTKRL